MWPLRKAREAERGAEGGCNGELRGASGGKRWVEAQELG